MADTTYTEKVKTTGALTSKLTHNGRQLRGVDATIFLGQTGRSVAHIMGRETSRPEVPEETSATKKTSDGDPRYKKKTDRKGFPGQGHGTFSLPAHLIIETSKTRGPQGVRGYKKTTGRKGTRAVGLPGNKKGGSDPA